MFIDTHCHLNYKPLSRKIPQIISNAKKQKVEKLICIGTNLQSSRESVEIAQKYNNVYAVVGIHPNDCENAPQDWNQQIHQLARKNKVVGIGETGVDLYRSAETVDLQKNFFEEHLKIGRSLDLPVIVHNRQADKATKDTLQKVGYGKFVMHCYSSDADYALLMLSYGGFISFTGNITYNSKKRTKAVKAVPMDKIMLETDAPFITPARVKQESKYNQPAYIPYIAEKIAEIKNIDITQVEKATTENAIDFFKLDT